MIYFCESELCGDDVLDTTQVGPEEERTQEQAGTVGAGSGTDMPGQSDATPVAAVHRVGGRSRPVAEEVSDERPRTVSTSLRWFHLVPVVNLMHDAFFDAPPSVSQLKEMLNTMALVSALMISVAFSVPGSIEFDEVVMAIDRFSADDTQFGGNYFTALADGEYGFVPYGVRENPTWTWWLWTTRQLTVSITSLGLTLTVVILIMFSMEKLDYTGPDGKNSQALYGTWWNWVRPAVFSVFVSMTVGVVSLFNSLTGIYLLKFPDKYWQHKGTYSYDNVRSVHAFYMDMTLYFMTGGIILIGILLPSFALSHKNWNSHKLQLEYNRTHQKKSELERWLESCKFPSRPSTNEENVSAEIYLARFKNAEITVDQIPLLSEEQLHRIGVPIGHALLIIKHCSSNDEEFADFVDNTDL